MDRGAWRTTVHGVTKVRHNLVTTPPAPPQMYIRKHSATSCAHPGAEAAVGSPWPAGAPASQPLWVLAAKNSLLQSIHLLFWKCLRIANGSSKWGFKRPAPCAWTQWFYSQSRAPQEISLRPNSSCDNMVVQLLPLPCFASFTSLLSWNPPSINQVLPGTLTLSTKYICKRCKCQKASCSILHLHSSHLSLHENVYLRQESFVCFCWKQMTVLSLSASIEGFPIFLLSRMISDLSFELCSVFSLYFS